MRVGGEADSVFGLGVGKPAGHAVGEDDVPFIPAALFPAINYASDDHEVLAVELAFRLQLDGGGVLGQVGDFSYFFEVHVVADDDGLAEWA